MNHITRLQRENAQLRLGMEAGYKALRDIVAYVESSKYHEWPYVNIEDIVLRCANGQSEIDFHGALCAVCAMAQARQNLICEDCATASEYGKAVA